MLWSDLAAETPRVGTRDLMVSDADQWRGSRSDHPGSFLACLRSMGLEPVI